MKIVNTMNPKSRSRFNQVSGCVLLTAGALAALRVSGAQSVLMGPPPSDTQPVAVKEDAANNEMNVFLPSYDVRDNSLPQPLKFGPVVVRPHPYYHFLYTTGLQSSTNSTQRSIIQEISPGVAIDFGRHWTLDYTPTFRFYSNHAFRDSVDHAATLAGGTRYEDWTFNLSQSYAQTDSTLAETATQTKQQTFDTELGGSRILNDKMYVDFGVSQVFNAVSGQQDSRTWSTMEWLNYQFNKRLNAGIGLGGGYVMVESEVPGPGNPDQAFEQMQARVQWRATDKLSLSVNGGFEEREILADGYNNELNPTFGASIQYAPFKQTQISLSAGRTVASSDFSILAQSTETTTVGINISQRLLEKYFINAGASFTQTEYTVAFGPISNLRTDDIYNFNVRVGRSFLKRGNVALTYQYSDNKSNQAGFSYISNQVGFEVGFTY